jgi:pyruvate/oxaloacetate carboxyltransferase
MAGNRYNILAAETSYLLKGEYGNCQRCRGEDLRERSH